MLLSSTLYTFIGNKNLWQVPNFNLILHMLCIILRKMSKCPGWPHGGPGRAMLPPPTFLCSKKKKRKQTKRVSKQKVFKGSHQGQNVTVLAILEGLQFKFFSCRPTRLFSVPWPSTLKSISPALNIYLRLSFLSTESYVTSAKLMLSIIFMLTCINISACSRLFSIVDLRYVLRFFKQKVNSFIKIH